MRVLEEAKKLVSFPSVTGSEEALARYLLEAFKSLGCKAYLYPVTKNRYNIYALLEGRQKDSVGLLFHGHLDTVAPHGMKDPFTPREEKGHLWGRGSVDQKGGIAAALAAFAEIAALQKTEGRRERGGADEFSGRNTPGVPQKPVFLGLKKGVAFVGVIDEESEHRGSMALKKMGIRAEGAVVTEPSALKIGIGCKGTLPLKITVTGRASHACRPWLGENALVHGMNLMQRILSEPLPEIDIPGAGKVRATLSLDKALGGKAYNIVPDKAVFWLDRRLIPGETYEGVINTLEKTLSGYDKPEDVSVTLEVARPDWRWKPVKRRGLLPTLIDASDPLVTVLKKTHQEVLGRAPVVYFTDGYNEMDFLKNDLGIPTLQYGPGDGGLCHTNQEQMEIRQLAEAVEVYCGVIKRICGEEDGYQF